MPRSVARTEAPHRTGRAVCRAVIAATAVLSILAVGVFDSPAHSAPPAGVQSGRTVETGTLVETLADDFAHGLASTQELEGCVR